MGHPRYAARWDRRLRGDGDGFFDAAGLPGFGGADKGSEEGAGERAGGVRPLGVPLDADDPMIGRGELDGFDDVVLRGDGSYTEIVAGDADGLVVAGVDGLLVQRDALRA